MPIKKETLLERFSMDDQDRILGLDTVAKLDPQEATVATSDVARTGR